MASDLERLVLKGAIAELPESDRIKVDECAAKLRQVVSEADEGAGVLALMLVMLEQNG
jgi:hypothetical protein